MADLNHRAQNGRRRRKWLLAIALAVSLGYLAVVELYVARRSPVTPKVVYKPATDLAKLAGGQDDYPCLVATPVRKAERWAAEVRWCMPALNNDADIEQYEVDLRTGMFVLRQTDLFIADVMPLALTRTYRLWDETPRAFGMGANQPYDIFPYGPRFPYSSMNVQLADGHALHYNRISEGTSYADAVFEHTGTPATVFEGSRIWWNQDHWDYKFQDGRLYRFPEAYQSKRGAEGALVDMHDAAGNEIKLTRDAARNLVRLTSPSGRSMRFAYDEANRMIAATDDSGQTLAYSYNDGGWLTEVRRNGKAAWKFTYDGDEMSAVQGTNATVLKIRYEHRRVKKVELSGGPAFHFDYLYSSPGSVMETSVWEGESRDNPARFRFDAATQRWQGGTRSK